MDEEMSGWEVVPLPQGSKMARMVGLVFGFQKENPYRRCWAESGWRFGDQGAGQACFLLK